MGGATRSLSGRPVAVAYVADPPLVLVADAADNRLLVFDDAEPPMLQTYRVGNAPAAIAVDPGTGLAYVSAKPLTVIDPATGDVKGAISVPSGGTPAGISVLDEPPAAVLCVRGASSGSLLVVPTDLTQPRATVDLGPTVDPVAVSGIPGEPDTAVVADRAGDQLLVVDLAAGITDRIPTGDEPNAVAVVYLDGDACWADLAAPPPTVTPKTGTCVGDCNGDGSVAINELILGVTTALGDATVAQCPAFDANDRSSYPSSSVP